MFRKILWSTHEYPFLYNYNIWYKCVLRYILGHKFLMQTKFVATF